MYRTSYFRTEQVTFLQNKLLSERNKLLFTEQVTYLRNKLLFTEQVNFVQNKSFCTEQASFIQRKLVFTEQINFVRSKLLLYGTNYLCTEQDT